MNSLFGRRNRMQWMRPWARMLLAATFAATLVIAASTGPAGAFPTSPSNIYVSNDIDSTASQYVAGSSGILTALAPSSVGTGANPQDIAVSPDGKSVYTTNANGNSVSQFSVASGGNLTPLSPSSVSAGTFPVGIVERPNGANLYVVNSFDSTVSQYNVGPGGTLSPMSPATVAIGAAGHNDASSEIAVSRNGQSAYVTNGEDGLVYQYDVGPTGDLSPKSPPSVSADGAGGIAASYNGTSVYVASSFGDVLQYDIAANGTLSPKSPPSVPAGDFPYLIAASPDGSVYATNAFGNDVSQYSSGPGGALVAKTPAIVPAGSDPRGIAVNQNATSVYVVNTNDNTVSQYDVGPGGTLSAKTPATAATGTGPQDVAVRGPRSLLLANGFLACIFVGKATFTPPLLVGATGQSTLTYKGTVNGCTDSAGIVNGKVEGAVPVPRDCGDPLMPNGTSLGASTASIKWRGDARFAPTQVADGTGSLVFDNNGSFLQLPAVQRDATLTGSYAGNATETLQVSFDQTLSQIETTCTAKTKGLPGSGGLKKLTFSLASSFTTE